MAEISSKGPIIRAMTPKDLDGIVEIDNKVLGKSRPEFWQMKLELVEKRSPMASLVAEIEGEIVGFIIGDASGWEYGVREHIGWIDTIGVDPDYQRRGIAKILFTEMVNNFKKVGVDTINTFVSWNDWSLLMFFEKMNFRKGEMINLELKI